MTFLYDVSVLSTSIVIAVTILYSADYTWEKIKGWADGE